MVHGKRKTWLNSISNFYRIPIKSISEFIAFDFQQDTRSRDDLPYLSLNIVPVYAMGYTGRGVRVCVIDDGLEHTHDDLRDNYVS